MVEIPAARLVHYQHSLAASEQENEQRQAEIDRLSSIVEELQDDNNDLANDVQGLLEENETLLKEVKEQSSLRKRVSKELSLIRSERDELFEKVEHLQIELDQFKSQQSLSSSSHAGSEVESIEQIKLSTKIQLRKSHEEKEQLVNILISVQKELDELREFHDSSRSIRRTSSYTHSGGFQIPDGSLRSRSVTDDVELVWECDSSVATKNNCSKEPSSSPTRLPGRVLRAASFRRPNSNSLSKTRSFRNRRQARRCRSVVGVGHNKQLSTTEDMTVSTPFTTQSDEPFSSDDDRSYRSLDVSSLFNRFQTPSFRLRQEKANASEEAIDRSMTGRITLEPTVEEESSSFKDVVCDEDQGDESVKSVDICNADDESKTSSSRSRSDIEESVNDNSEERECCEETVVSKAVTCTSEIVPSRPRFALPLTAMSGSASGNEQQRQLAHTAILAGLRGEIMKEYLPRNVRRSRWGSKVFGAPARSSKKRRSRRHPRPVVNSQDSTVTV